MLSHLLVPSSLHSFPKPAKIHDTLSKCSFTKTSRFLPHLFVVPPGKASGCSHASLLQLSAPHPASSHHHERIKVSNLSRAFPAACLWVSRSVFSPVTPNSDVKRSALQGPLPHSPQRNVSASEEGIKAEASKKRHRQVPEPHAYSCAYAQATSVLVVPVIGD